MVVAKTLPEKHLDYQLQQRASKRSIFICIQPLKLKLNNDKYNMDNKNEFKKKSCSIVKGKKQTKK